MGVVRTVLTIRRDHRLAKYEKQAELEALFQEQATGTLKEMRKDLEENRKSREKVISLMESMVAKMSATNQPQFPFPFPPPAFFPPDPTGILPPGLPGVTFPQFSIPSP